MHKPSGRVLCLWQKLGRQPHPAWQRCCKQHIKTDKSQMLTLCSDTLILCVQVTLTITATRDAPLGLSNANNYTHSILGRMTSETNKKVTI